MMGSSLQALFEGMEEWIFAESISLFFPFVVAVILFAISGCRKNTVAPEISATTVSSNQDAAQSIANAVGEDNGGLSDQMGDIADATGSAGVSTRVGSEWIGSGLGKAAGGAEDSVTKVFDASDTSWTVYITRNRGGLLGREAAFVRTYYLKFIDPSGTAIPRYTTSTPADTASTILFKVLSGSGHVITRFVSTHLLSIAGDFVVTNANSSTLTFNGTLTRTGTDTINTFNGQRVLNYTLVANLQNVTGPRTPRYLTSTRMVRVTGGTVSGTYTATVSVLKGSSYAERSFAKTFTVTFGGGTGLIEVGGSQYSCDLQVGEVSTTQ
jgi:hypothetical protein